MSWDAKKYIGREMSDDRLREEYAEVVRVWEEGANEGPWDCRRITVYDHLFGAILRGLGETPVTAPKREGEDLFQFMTRVEWVMNPFTDRNATDDTYTRRATSDLVYLRGYLAVITEAYPWGVAVRARLRKDFGDKDTWHGRIARALIAEYDRVRDKVKRQNGWEWPD